jgi:UDP-N-acetylglucosamine--N-acetylmuramyl-(pentapeptide) pyrophosphoryl-undecaprenol N-acetylglucosamine transferase
MKVVIAGGGTAGHVSPALALAAALADHDVTFVGTSKGAEAELVPAAGGRLETIDVRGFDRGRPWTIVPTGIVAARAIASARRLLTRIDPDVVVGMGGYVSLPVCLAARMRRTPVVVHEQNIVLGLANKVSKRFAAVVAVSFEETLEDAGPKGVVTGNPVLVRAVDWAEEKRRGLRRFGLDPARTTVLVFGGSLGAERLNAAVLELARTWANEPGVQIVHILGRARSDFLPQAQAIEHAEGPLIYRPLPWVDRMVEAYAVADVAVCRGGASTIAELAAASLPAIIVPYPHHRDRQQERQAGAMASRGGAIVLADAAATPARLGAEIKRLISNPEVLADMRRAQSGWGGEDAAERLARIVVELAA